MRPAKDAKVLVFSQVLFLAVRVSFLPAGIFHGHHIDFLHRKFQAIYLEFLDDPGMASMRPKGCEAVLR